MKGQTVELTCPLFAECRKANPVYNFKLHISTRSLLAVSTEAIHTGSGQYTPNGRKSVYNRREMCHETIARCVRVEKQNNVLCRHR